MHLLTNLSSPMVLCFILGVVAGISRSDLTIPECFTKTLSIYLMLAIGLKGGYSLQHCGTFTTFVPSLLVGIALSFALPFISYAILCLTRSTTPLNAAAISAHYGSVSVVTFAAATTYLADRGIPFEPYMVALLSLMETPAIVSGLLLAKRKKCNKNLSTSFIFNDVILNKSVVLLTGGFLIGFTTTSQGFDSISPFFIEPFKGVVCLFLLDLGLLVAEKLREQPHLNIKLVLFGFYMPLTGSLIGMACGWALGLSLGGATLFAVLAGSASYIAVPAAMRSALPEADASQYVTLSLGITFPFNIILGIPLYYTLTSYWLNQARPLF